MKKSSWKRQEANSEGGKERENQEIRKGGIREGVREEVREINSRELPRGQISTG